MSVSEPRRWREPWLTLWAGAAAFGVYFAMYAFRKPFEVGKYTGPEFFTLLVTAQTIGYALSKVVGIKIVSEMPAQARLAWLLGLVGLAELALLGFAVVPPPWNLVFLFLNGLPLGMVFGLVMAFLEGRQTTEVLLACLCSSFIVASGAVKSVGKQLLLAGVDEYWMPYVTGLFFVPLLFLCTWMLSRLPPPSEADVAHRSARVPMHARERWAFLRKYALGVALLVTFYLLLTILRSVRDVYANDLWSLLGYGARASVFAQSETLVMVGVVLLNALAMVFRNNRIALLVALGTAGGGLVLLLAALAGYQAEYLDGFAYMVLIGLGGYLAYVAFHTTLLDRLIALLRDRGNIGFLMYLADSAGYLGFLVFINLAAWQGCLQKENLLGFFFSTNLVVGALALVVAVALVAYFARVSPAPDETQP